MHPTIGHIILTGRFPGDCDSPMDRSRSRAQEGTGGIAASATMLAVIAWLTFGIVWLQGASQQPVSQTQIAGAGR